MAKLYFRYGSMNSGKSTILMQVAHNYEERGMKVAILKPSIDTKGDNKIVTRIGLEIKNSITYWIRKRSRPLNSKRRKRLRII